MLLKSYMKGTIFWRVFHPADRIYAVGLREGFLTEGGTADFNFAGGQFQLEIKRWHLGGPFLVRAGAVINNSDDVDILESGSLAILSTGFSQTERDLILDRITFAYNAIGGCSNLSGDEKNGLLGAFFKGVLFRPTAENVNGQAQLWGHEIQLNLSVLGATANPNEEISQTIIHELMHIAGFSHPVRRDGDCTKPDPAAFDCPGDGGPYYGTPPLRAEFCIAGAQSRTEKPVRGRECSISETGVAKVHPKKRA